jgi:hypothetical protein
MSEHTPINITIDEAALREQVRAVIAEELAEMSSRLHRAAYQLDPEGSEAAFEAEYQRGVEDGRAAAQESPL